MKYQEFLKIIKNSCYTVKPLKEYNENDKKVIYLRHDIDYDIDIAYKMALLENANDIRSTYFVLHTADHFVYEWSFRMIESIQKMRHEIGIHNNELIYRRNGQGYSLKSALNVLRNNNISIVGTSSHGDYNLKKISKNAMNYDLFKIEPLETFGLEYEASHLKVDYYNSDAGCKFWYKGGDVIKEIQEGNHNLIQLNLHPIWWKDKI